MLNNKEKVFSIVSEFLSSYLKNSTQKNFLVIYTGNLNEWLAIKLCESARAKTGASIFYTCLNTSNIPKFEFANQISLPEENFIGEVVKFSKENDCLIVSSLDINNGILKRKYDKHLYVADVYPLLDLYSMECISMSTQFDVPEYINIENDELAEYCHREDLKNGIILSDELPNKHKLWFKYTKSQKEMIAKLHQREKITRHKSLLSRGVPYPRIRNTGYVK